MSISKQQFKNLVNLDIRDEVEQDYKGLNYLSWASAYQLMMEQDADATYEVVKAEDGMPFFTRGETHMVFTRVTMFGTTKEMWLPVMDNKHNAVANPTSRQISDNIMRCLVKNIAMFGIGLRLFKKEGLDEFQVDDTLLGYIANLMKELGMKKEDLEDMAFQTYGKDNLRSLTKDEATDMVKQLKNIRRNKQREVSNATSETVTKSVSVKMTPTPTAPTVTEVPVVEETPVQPVQEPVRVAKEEAEVAAEITPVVTPSQEITPTVEVQVENVAPAIRPTIDATTGLLTAEQYKEITALYREKKLTKEQLKEEVVAVAPKAKGIKEMTTEQADEVIKRLQSYSA